MLLSLHLPRDGSLHCVSPIAEAALKQSSKSQLRGSTLPFMYCLYSSLVHDDRISLRSILYANCMVSG